MGFLMLMDRIRACAAQDYPTLDRALLQGSVEDVVKRLALALLDAQADVARLTDRLARPRPDAAPAQDAESGAHEAAEREFERRVELWREHYERASLLSEQRRQALEGLAMRLGALEAKGVDGMVDAAARKPASRWPGDPAARP